MLFFKVEPEKYERGIIWLHELLYKTVITEERIQIVATKLVNEVSHVKRKGNLIVKELMKGILYDDSKCSSSILKFYINIYAVMLCNLCVIFPLEHPIFKLYLNFHVKSAK